MAHQPPHSNSRYASLRTGIPLILIVVLAAATLHYRTIANDLRTYFDDHIRKDIPLETIREAFPSAAAIIFPDNITDPALIHDATKEPIGRLLHSSPHCDDIRGYAGPVPLVIALDAHADTIRAVLLLQNDETRGFINRLRQANFFDSWNGVSTARAADTTIDAVSMATMTSAAVIASVQRRTALYEGATRRRGARAATPILAVVFMLPGLLSLLFPRHTRRIRPLVLAANVAVLGFGTGSLFSLALINGAIIHGIDLGAQWHLAALALATVGIALFSGKNLYCGYLCPYGSAQELVGRYTRRWHRRLPHWLQKPLRHSRTTILAALFILAFAWPPIDLAAVEPFSAFIPAAAPRTSILLAVLFVLLSTLRPRLWCSGFCPTGRLVDVFRIRQSGHRRDI